MVKINRAMSLKNLILPSIVTIILSTYLVPSLISMQELVSWNLEMVIFSSSLYYNALNIIGEWQRTYLRSLAQTFEDTENLNLA